MNDKIDYTLRDRHANIMIAGWTETPRGLWTHADVGGIHNLASAERITDAWAN